MGENILAFTNFSGAWENVCQHPDRRVYTAKGKLAARYASLLVRPSVLTACESVPKDPHMEKLKGEIDAVAWCYRGILQPQEVRQNPTGSYRSTSTPLLEFFCQGGLSEISGRRQHERKHQSEGRRCCLASG